MQYLVPLDGSDLAEQALPYARERAALNDGSILLVRVVTVARQLAAASMTGAGGIDAMPISMEAINAAIDLEQKESLEYLALKGEEIRKAGLKVEWEVRQGIPADEIIASARAHNIDVIVITTHGRSGLGRVVFGSVADRIIRQSGIPVLVIGPK
ncbi:MAG: universal stress protein [Chloroflexi bacterium]|nr:universal stress protein [Chloroflexota bacterium]MBI4197701.1 universal stress protein [Chloroflexota bacterium]